ncbi:hypothetical protein SAMN05421505_104304, partial [Sinosporangium album]
MQSDSGYGNAGAFGGPGRSGGPQPEQRSPEGLVANGHSFTSPGDTSAGQAHHATATDSYGTAAPMERYGEPVLPAGEAHPGGYGAHVAPGGGYGDAGFPGAEAGHSGGHPGHPGGHTGPLDGYAGGQAGIGHPDETEAYPAGQGGGYGGGHAGPGGGYASADSGPTTAYPA